MVENTHKVFTLIYVLAVQTSTCIIASSVGLDAATTSVARRVVAARAEQPLMVRKTPQSLIKRGSSEANAAAVAALAVVCGAVFH